MSREQIDRYVEQEEERLEDEYTDGFISNKEYNAAIKELHREARGELEEEAQRAYDEVMGNF